MDPGSISFQDINIRQKLFQERIEDLIESVRVANESELKISQNSEPLNSNDNFHKNIKELSEEMKYQQLKEAALLKEQALCSERIAHLNDKIVAMEEALQKFKQEESTGKEELKQIKKPLLKAIKKYSTAFNMNLEVKKQVNEHVYMVAVRFSSDEDAKTVDFMIDRTQKMFIDFDASSFLSDDETQRLKTIVMTENGLNVNLLLCKLREKL